MTVGVCRCESMILRRWTAVFASAALVRMRVGPDVSTCAGRTVRHGHRIADAV